LLWSSTVSISLSAASRFSKEGCCANEKYSHALL
jgi:hypothetical protein